MANQKNELIDLGARGMPLTVVGTNMHAGKVETRTIDVWLEKLNDFDHEKAIKRADSARARVLSLRKHTDADEYLAIEAEVLEVSDPEVLIDKIVSNEADRIRLRNEAQVADEEEWSTDNYLDGLRTAWIGGEEDGLAKRYLVDPDDAEAKRVFAELQRFRDAVDERVEIDVDNARSAYAEVDLDELRDLTMKQFVEDAALDAWVKEYRGCQIWLGTRRCKCVVDDAHPEHQARHPDRYFAERHEVDLLQKEVKDQLTLGFDVLLLNPVEGKDEPVGPGSSPVSDSPEAPVTDVPSGLVEQPA